MNLRLTRYLLVALLLGAIALPADTVVEEIVARINNDVITRSEMQRSRQQLRDEVKREPNPDEAYAQREKNLLRDMIDQQLLIQRARDLGLNADAELIRRLDEVRKNAGLETLEDLEKAAEQQGVNYEDWKQHIRNQILTQQVIGREVGSKIQLSQEEMQQFYEEHKQRFAKPEQVRLSEILIPVEKPAVGSTPEKPATEPMTEAEIAQQRAKADQALQQIRGGASFDEVAKKVSSGPSAPQGGDLGYFPRGQLAKELETLTFDKMKEGDVSDIIRTRQGFVILKVTEHQQPGVPPLKQVEREVQEGLYYSKLQPALRAYLTRLREEAYIDLKEGYVDTGASPNQTKPFVSTVAREQREREREKEEKRKFYCLWMCKS